MAAMDGRRDRERVLVEGDNDLVIGTHILDDVRVRHRL
jgi:hypothetical protein